MKKILALFLVLSMSIIFVSCASDNTAPAEDSSSEQESQSEQDELLTYRKEEESGSDEIMEITENYFTEQINFIYYNPDEYLGKTITYEGIYDKGELASGESMDYVFRYGPGCCSNDANVGFEVIGSPSDFENLTPNDWVKVTGTVEMTSHDGLQYLCLLLSEIQKMDVRGAETVS